MRTIAKMFIMVCILGLTTVSCSKEDLSEEHPLEVVSSEGDDGEVEDKPSN